MASDSGQLPSENIHTLFAEALQQGAAMMTLPDQQQQQALTNTNDITQESRGAMNTEIAASQSPQLQTGGLPPYFMPPLVVAPNNMAMLQQLNQNSAQMYMFQHLLQPQTQQPPAPAEGMSAPSNDAVNQGHNNFAHQPDPGINFVQQGLTTLPQAASGAIQNLSMKPGTPQSLPDQESSNAGDLQNLISEGSDQQEQDVLSEHASSEENPLLDSYQLQQQATQPPSLDPPPQAAVTHCIPPAIAPCIPPPASSTITGVVAGQRSPILNYQNFYYGFQNLFKFQPPTAVAPGFMLAAPQQFPPLYNGMVTSQPQLIANTTPLMMQNYIPMPMVNPSVVVNPVFAGLVPPIPPAGVAPVPPIPPAGVAPVQAKPASYETITLPAAESVNNRKRLPMPIFLDYDEGTLTEYQCLLRKQIELCEAGPSDTTASAQGRNNPVLLGQVGIQCRYCAVLPLKSRPRGAVYYSRTIVSTLVVLIWMLIICRAQGRSQQNMIHYSLYKSTRMACTRLPKI
jgi:hypothetical protein